MMRAMLVVAAVIPACEGEIVEMHPVCGKPFGTDGLSEENTYARWTPSGVVRLEIQNPALVGKIKVGKRFFADFTEIEEAVVTESKAPETAPSETNPSTNP